MSSTLNAAAPEFRPASVPVAIPALPEDPFDLNNPSEVRRKGDMDMDTVFCGLAGPRSGRGVARLGFTDTRDVGTC